MKKIEIYCVNTQATKSYELGTSLLEISKDLNIKLKNRVCGAIVNNQLKELSFMVVKPKTVEFIDLSHPDGIRMFNRSLLFVLYTAVNEVFPGVILKIQHGISHGFFCELEGLDRPVTDSDIFSIGQAMQSLIQQDIPFIKKGLLTENAVALFRRQGLEDKARLFEQQGQLYSHVYFMDGLADYFYGCLLPSTGYITNFDIVPYFDGILLRFPSPADFHVLQGVTYQKKLFGVYQQHKDWAGILNVSTISHLNDFTLSGRSGEIIKISEALHEKRVAEIANLVTGKKDMVKVVLISGPSASGKTTFSKRLGVQLSVNGIKPYQISLDNYFVDREHTPKDEQGNPDFEALESIDIEYFNRQLLDLFNGKEVQLPLFDFNSGKRYYNNVTLKFSGDDILIIEGIHGMNPNLIPHIDPKNTFRIFLSALTQVSYDEHNHVSTTDNRLIRRMIRDSRYRGYPARETLRRWPSVRRGEERNIFPYQENADIMFNSATLYELAVLKKYAEPLLKSVPENQPEYCEAIRLCKFLSYFKPVDDAEIPPTSVLREFLGGSSFAY